MADSAQDRTTKLAALKERIVSVTKSTELLAVARELEAIGHELAREERPERPTTEVAWPRDMNESADLAASPAWGKDPAEDVRG